jgi:hypothetical protein
LSYSFSNESNSGTDTDGQYFGWNDTLYTSEYELENSNNDHNYLWSIQLIKYFIPKDKIGFKVGSGPIVGFGKSRSSSKRIRIDEYEVESITELSKFYYGLSVLCGIEYYFKKSIHFHIEYHSQFESGNTSQNNTNFVTYSDDEWNRKEVALDGNISELNTKVITGITLFF